MTSKLSPRLRLLSPVSASARQTTQPAPGQLWRGEWLNSTGATQSVAVRFGTSSDPTAVQRDLELYTLQAQAGAHLKDPRLLQVLDCGTVPLGTVPSGLAFHVVEWVEVESLRQCLHASGALSLDDAVAFVSQATQLLTHLHAAGIVHGRLRPEHIFSSSSRFKMSPPAFVQSHTSGLASSQIVPRAYESPARLLQAGPPTTQDDLWSLTVTIYEALTTVLPFDAPTEAGEAVAICNAAFGPPSRYRVDLPLKIDLWFARALSKNPLDRFRTPSELYSSFSRACDRDDTGHALERLDEDLDDEKTAQWELPEEWIAPTAAPVPTPQAVFTAALPNQPGQAQPVAPPAAMRPMAPPPSLQATRTAPPQMVSVPPVGSQVTPSVAAPERNTASLIAGVLGLILLVALGVWKFLPQGNAEVELPQAEFNSEQPSQASGALKVTDLEEQPLRTINAADYVAHSNDAPSVDKAQPDKAAGAAQTTRRSRVQKRGRKSARKTPKRTTKKPASKKRTTKKSKRRATRRKSSAKPNPCISVDAQGIKRIKPSCL